MKTRRLTWPAIILSLLIVAPVGASARPDAYFQGAAGCTPGATYHPDCDVNKDGTTDVVDIGLVAGHYTHSGNPTLSAYWALTGNSGTSATSNFLGTTDRQSLVIRTNDTERMRVTDVGRVGIGNTNPDALLAINATSPTDALRVRVDGTTEFMIDQEGRVGINTSLPSASLEVHPDSGEPPLTVYRFGTTQPHFLVDATGNVGIGTATPGDALTVYNTGSGRAGYFQTDNTGNNAAALSAVVQNGNGNALFANILDTGNSSPALFARTIGIGPAARFEGDVHILNGNLGVGTASPANRVTVRDTNHQIAIVDSDNADKTWTLTTQQAGSGFGIYEDGTSGRFLVESGGQVGIGTTAPASKVHIVDGTFARVRMTATDPASDVTMIVDARGDGTNRGQVGTLSNHDVIFVANNSLRMIMRAGGEVCIGSGCP